jgi:hypothetical protein
MKRLIRRWRMMPHEIRFAIIAFIIAFAVAVAIIVFLPPLLRGGLPLCRP